MTATTRVDADAGALEKGPDRCATCGRFMKPSAVQLCGACRTTVREAAAEAPAAKASQLLDASPTIDVVPYRAQHDIVIPVPSRLHPDRAPRPAAGVLHTIGPAAASRRQTRRFGVSISVLRTVGIVVVIVLAMAAGAAIAIALSSLG